MMTCKTCRFWRADKPDRYFDSIISPWDPVTYGHEPTEEAIIAKWGHAVRYCTSPKIVFYQRPDADGATVCDGSEYQAELLTGQDFGCVQHQPIDGEEPWPITCRARS